jgi:hypothetical protein
MNPTIRTFLVSYIAVTAVAAPEPAKKDDLRIFLLPAPEVVEFAAQQDFKRGRLWMVADVHDFLLLSLRDGSEFGRQVPALWVYRKDATYALAIVDESLRFETEFRNARVEGKDILVFEIGNGKKWRTVRMNLLWQPKRRKVLVAERDVEVVGP